METVTMRRSQGSWCWYVAVVMMQWLLLVDPASSSSRPLDPGSQQDAALEIDANTFNSTLLSAPARWAIVEFYASWCPACRNYKPQYEKVARLFNGGDAAHPGVVFMAKVDCASKVNAPLCDRFSIQHYPTLLWGTPSSFAQAQAGHAGGWEMVENGRKAELLLQFINTKIDKAYKLDDAVTLETPLMLGESLDYGQVAISNYDIEEATAKAMDIILTEKLLNQKTRSSFIQFFQLLVVHHPSKNCRRGIGELLMNVEDIWPALPKEEERLTKEISGEERLTKETSGDPSIQDPDYKLLEQVHICGDHVPRGYWIYCRGRRDETRGYSCGLWLLLHAISVRVEDKLALSALRTICSFVAKFFNCKECQEHFLEFCSSAQETVSSRRQLVLWLWNSHNEVNERVGKVEAAAGTGDPKFHKAPWPPKSLCKSCWKDDNSNLGLEEAKALEKPSSYSEVYNFLLIFYGHALSPPNSSVLVTKQVALPKVVESSTQTVVTVPVGAAVAIAFASCGFGAVACFWRTRQKKRKQLRRRV